LKGVQIIQFENKKRKNLFLKDIFGIKRFMEMQKKLWRWRKRLPSSGGYCGLFVLDLAQMFTVRPKSEIWFCNDRNSDSDQKMSDSVFIEWRS